MTGRQRKHKEIPNGTRVLSLGSMIKGEFTYCLVRMSFSKVFWVWLCLLNNKVTHRCLDLLLLLWSYSLPKPEMMKGDVIIGLVPSKTLPPPPFGVYSRLLWISWGTDFSIFKSETHTHTEACMHTLVTGKVEIFIVLRQGWPWN